MEYTLGAEQGLLTVMGKSTIQKNLDSMNMFLKIKGEKEPKKQANHDFY